MIIFRAKTEIEKTFAENTRADDLDKISKFNDKICIEIMKMMEMYDTNKGQHLYHWMRNLTKSFFDSLLNTKTIMVGGKRPQLGFVKVDHKNVEKQLGKDFVNKYLTISPKEYILLLKDQLLKMKDGINGIKYVDSINNNGGFIYSEEDYIDFLKYIGLCLSGQLNYEVTNFWNDLNVIKRLNIDYLKKPLSSVNNQYLEKTIGNCLYQLKYNVPDESETILRYI